MPDLHTASQYLETLLLHFNLITAWCCTRELEVPFRIGRGGPFILETSSAEGHSRSRDSRIGRIKHYAGNAKDPIRSHTSLLTPAPHVRLAAATPTTST